MKTELYKQQLLLVSLSLATPLTPFVMNTL